MSNPDTKRSLPDRGNGRHRGLVASGLAVCCAVLMLCPRPAGASGYSSGGSFLPLGHGARLHGMGTTGVALLRDDAAAYWNPANLAWLQQANGITLMHADILDQIDDGYETVSFGRAAGGRLGAPEQALRPTRWGYGLFVSHLGFTFASGSGWSENVFQFSAALSLSNYASVGASLKGLQAHNDFEAGDAQGLGCDLALTVLVLDDLTLAVVGRDLYTRVQWDTGRWETLQAEVTAGLEFRPGRRWILETDAALRQGALHIVAGGAEWQAYRELLWLRAGLTYVAPGESRVYPSAGVGFRLSRLVLDYGAAFDEEDALGIGQRVSLRIVF